LRSIPFWNRIAAESCIEKIARNFLAGIYLAAGRSQRHQPLYCARQQVPSGEPDGAIPLNPHGALARGAIVTLICPERIQRRAIDAGSGYLCQMEPVAHFGLGQNSVIEQIEIRWPTGARAVIESPRPRQTLRVPHP
jgi:hypothetical protein